MLDVSFTTYFAVRNIPTDCAQHENVVAFSIGFRHERLRRSDRGNVRMWRRRRMSDFSDRFLWYLAQISAIFKMGILCNVMRCYGCDNEHFAGCSMPADFASSMR